MVGINKLSTSMKNKRLIVKIIFLCLIITSCKTQKNAETQNPKLSEITDLADFIIKPKIEAEKQVSTEYEILEIKQQGQAFLDITVMPSIGCKSYNYEAISLPITPQGTKLKFEFMLIQKCNEQSTIIEKKNRVRLDLSDLIPLNTTQKTIEISFTKTNQTINFNLEK